MSDFNHCFHIDMYTVKVYVCFMGNLKLELLPRCTLYSLEYKITSLLEF